MHIVKKQAFFIFFFGYFWASELETDLFYAFPNKALCIRKTYNNDSVNRYFKTKISLPFYINTITICKRVTEVNKSPYIYISWFTKKLLNAFNNKSKFFENIYSEEKNLKIIQKIEFLLCSDHLYLIKTVDLNDLCCIWAKFLSDYRKKYISDAPFIDFSLENTESQAEIDGFLSFKNKQKCSLDDVFKQINKITYENVSNFKNNYITKSFDELIKIYKNHYKDDGDFITFKADYQLQKIQFNEEYLSIFVDRWEYIFLKSLPFSLLNDSVRKNTLEKNIIDVKNHSTSLNKVLKKIADLNYSFFCDEEEIFGYLFKNITAIPPINRNFFVGLKENLLKTVNEGKIDNCEKIKAIIDKRESLNIKDDNKKIKQQLLNVRAFLLLYALEKYKNIPYTFLENYFNSIPEQYKESIDLPENIRKSCSTDTKMFAYDNIFAFIQSVERYKKCLSKKNILSENYITYINTFICPLLSTIYEDYDMPLLSLLKNNSLLKQLHILVQWEKDSFIAIKTQYYTAHLNEIIRKNIPYPHYAMVYNSNEYKHIKDMMREKESYLRDWTFSYEKIKEKSTIDNYTTMLNFMEKEKIMYSLQNDISKDISLLEHMCTIWVSCILPHFEKFKNNVTQELPSIAINEQKVLHHKNFIRLIAEKKFDDISSIYLIRYINNISSSIAQTLLEKHFNEIYTWCKENEFILGSDPAWQKMNLIDINDKKEEVIQVIIDIIKHKLCSFCKRLQTDSYLENLLSTALEKSSITTISSDLSTINACTDWEKIKTIFDSCISLIKNLLYRTDNYLSVIIEYKLCSENSLLWILEKTNPYLQSNNHIYEFIFNLTKTFIKNLRSNLTSEHINRWLDNPERKRTSIRHFTDLTSCHLFLDCIKKDISKNTLELKLQKFAIFYFKTICELYAMLKLPPISQESV